MIKDFSSWHRLKQHIDTAERPAPLGYKERDVWWLAIGHNVGFEENGKGDLFSRPVLVVKGFSNEIFWGVPLTTSPVNNRFHFTFRISGSNQTSTAILSQLRVFDTRRMTSKLGMVSVHDFIAIKRRLRDFIK